MLRLMLLRHAKSDWSQPGLADVARLLNGRGEAAARLMGAYMAHHALIPARAVCSPAQRTRDTWGLVAGEWALPVEARFDERLYAASPDAILSVIQDQDDAARTLLVLGHNPGLQQVAELLVASGDVVVRERLHEKFPTAALAVIDFAADDWRRVHAGSGRLERFVTPRQVAAQTK